jgi:hypothetical protein
VSRGVKGKKPAVSRADSIGIVILATVIAGVPILGTVFISTATSEPDLSELAPINNRIANYVVLNWSELLQDRPSDMRRAPLQPSDGKVQALGYMFDGDRQTSKGEWVKEFVLLPDAGTLVHPAHRIRDQMIAVHLEDSKRIQFSPRSLIWVWGSFAVSSEPAVRSKPLYSLEQARVKLADKADIRRYFK